MGLAISGLGSGLRYGRSYGGIHQVRAFALVVAGHYDTISNEMIESWRKNSIIRNEHFGDEARWHMTHDYLSTGDQWVKYPQFWQLLHFSDCEGFLVPDTFLEGYDYSKSFYLGSSERLLRELNIIKEEIDKNPEKYVDFMYPIEIFNELHALVDDEVTNHHGVLRFC